MGMSWRMIQFFQIYFFLAVIYEVDPVPNEITVALTIDLSMTSRIRRPPGGWNLYRVNRQAAMFDTG